MNKRGAIEAVFVVIASVIIASSIIIGLYVVEKDQIGAKTQFSEAKYVGNMKTQQVYNYECLEHIPQVNRLFFNDLDIARKEGYSYNWDCL